MIQSQGQSIVQRLARMNFLPAHNLSVKMRNVLQISP